MDALTRSCNQVLLRCGASGVEETDKQDDDLKPGRRIKDKNAIPLLHQAAACGRLNVTTTHLRALYRV
jgi:hypothetical protein